MSHTIGSIIADSLNLGLNYAERLTEGIPESDFGCLPRCGEQVIQSNHPAFVMGHLSLYAPRIVHQLGGDAIELPEGFEALFSKDASCEDDPHHTIYPSKAVITQAFFRGYHQAVDELKAAADEIFAQPNPAPAPLRDRFPTLGSMHCFYAGGHLMLHLGQLSAWRRFQGLPPA